VSGSLPEFEKIETVDVGNSTTIHTVLLLWRNELLTSFWKNYKIKTNKSQQLLN